MTDFLKPTTRGRRDPLDNGSPSDKIANPPRYSEIGGLTSPSKVTRGRNSMTVRKPGGEK